MMTDRVYRDPVHGSIAFDRENEGYLIELIDTPEFQRLRRVRQLGAAYLVFHGAEHSRFSHSLGVAHLAKRMFLHLCEDPNFPRDLDKAELRKTVIAGALLHDVGHGPFSHLFERVFTHKDHERWGLEIIEDPETQIHQILKNYGLVDSIKRIFNKNLKPPFAWAIISSQLDADRLDYLLRDSFMTGVAYGRYDLDWLLGVIELARIPADGKDLGLAVNLRKGLHAAEQFVIGRHLMYQQVYFHKTIRSAERMIKILFEYLADIAKEDIYPRFCPEPLRRLLDPDKRRMTLQAYLQLDDEFMLACFNLWSHDEKERDILRDLSARLIRRDLFKTVLIDPDKSKDDLKYADAISSLKESMQKDGFDPRYYLAFDAAEDFPYKDMMWYVAKDKTPEDIWLAEDGVGKHVLSDPTVSPLIDSVRNTLVRAKRLCFPAEIRPLVSKHLGRYLTDRVENGLVAKRSQVSVQPAG